MIEERHEIRGLEMSREIQRRILEQIEAQSWDPSSCFAIRLALEEALSNAYKHGNAGDPDKPVHLSYSISPDAIEIEVRDEGPGFDPGAVPDPTLEENLEIPSGRGIVLMKSFMSRVEYVGAGNHVRMRYERPDPDDDAAD